MNTPRKGRSQFANDSNTRRELATSETESNISDERALDNRAVSIVHAEALRRLAAARENDYRRYLLFDCLEAYAKLDEVQGRELEVLLRTDRYQGAQAMAVTTVEKGLQQGQRTMLKKLLEARFGPLSASAGQRLDVLGPEGLDALALELLNAQSLQELGLED